MLPPKSELHAFHARVISTVKRRLSNRSEGHNRGTYKLLRKHCDLTEIGGVFNLFLLIEDSEWAFWSTTCVCVCVLFGGSVHVRVTFIVQQVYIFYRYHPSHATEVLY